jgi:hypothetical protein
MAKCSIPNSSPASGRISTRSLRRSRKQNSQPSASASVIHRSAFSLQKRPQVRHVESVLWRWAAIQSTLRARKIQSVIRNRQSAIRRVKGAWWSSRSSKPSSSRKWRGRFDSYPLRQIIFDCRLPARTPDDSFNRQLEFENRKSREGR